MKRREEIRIWTEAIMGGLGIVLMGAMMLMIGGLLR